MLSMLGELWNHRCSGSPGTDHQHFFAGVVRVWIPQLRVGQHAAKGVHAGPLRNMRILVIVIALAHPQKVAGKGQASAVRFARRRHCPLVILGGPTAVGDPVTVANVLVNTVFLDHLTHVFEDCLGASDGCISPRFEAIAEGIKVRIRAYTRVFVRFPSTAEGILHFENTVALVRALLLQMIRLADARNACADDEYVKVCGFLCR